MNMAQKTVDEADSVDPLCCCEYINVEGEKSHILAVCCDCETIDDTCDRWLKRIAVPESNYSKIRSTVQDRLRIPWIGGARQCTWELLIPLITPPLLLFLSTLSGTAMIFSFICLPLMMLASRLALYHRPKSQFYYQWTISTFFTLLIVFELCVVPMLTISWYEHLILSSLVSISLLCWYRVRASRGFCSRPRGESLADTVPDHLMCDRCAVPQPPRAFHCSTCDRCVYLRDHHCVWLDCCVGGSNQRPFVAGLLSVTLALLFASQLTLTSVCRCHPLLVGLMVPVSCDLMSASESAAVFAAVYAVLVAGLCGALLLQQCHLVSRGVTGSERRRRLPGAPSGGLVDNWRRFVAGRRPHERPASPESAAQVRLSVPAEETSAAAAQ